jgi:hypothetical protein
MSLWRIDRVAGREEPLSTTTSPENFCASAICLRITTSSFSTRAISPRFDPTRTLDTANATSGGINSFTCIEGAYTLVLLIIKLGGANVDLGNEAGEG